LPWWQHETDLGLPREKNISESAVLLVFLFCREAVAVASED
jgi:hypothetical protein